MNAVKKFPDIALTPVKESKLLAGIGHDPATNTLAIEFSKGGIYHYQGVTAKDFAALQAAKSQGSHFGTAIRGKFDSARLPDAKKK